MFKKLGLLITAIFILVGFFTTGQSRAQTVPDGTTLYELNIRSGPGTTYKVLTTLPSNTGMIFEARNANRSWLLGYTLDGTYRGWVASLYLSYRDGFSAANLPISDERIVSSPANPPSEPATAPEADVAPGLEGVTIAPGIGNRVREIYLHGQELGNNPRGITRVGECNSMSHAFLMPFGRGQYELGPYSYLQSTIDFFPGTSWSHESVAARAGLSSNMVIDASMSDPGLCGGQSLLECEYALSKPSVAFIMLGLQDVYFLSAEQYQQAMRRIIEISIERGVIPVLATFPAPPGDYPVRDEARNTFNAIVINLAHEYDVPVMNLWQATQGMPNHGIGVDFVHISERGDNWTSFNGDENQWGFTMWNLLALQTLSQLETVMN